MAFRLRDAYRILREGGPGTLLRFAGERLGSYRAFRRWVQALPTESALEDVVEILVDRSQGERQPVYAWQKKREILALLERVRALQPRRVLEIGTAAGGTLLLWSRVAAADASLISIDMPEGHFGGGYNPLRSRLYKSFARDGQSVTLIRGDSHAKATRTRLAAILGGERLDFLFLDGDHTAAGARQDFEDYAPFVRPSGLIAFHDICLDERGWSGDVQQVWSELASRFESEELVDRSGPAGYGIGLLRWPG